MTNQFIEGKQSLDVKIFSLVPGPSNGPLISRDYIENGRKMLNLSVKSLEAVDYQIPLTITLLVKLVIGWQFDIGNPPHYRRVPQ
jgi:hypothetical protein